MEETIADLVPTATGGGRELQPSASGWDIAGELGLQLNTALGVLESVLAVAEGKEIENVELVKYLKEASHELSRGKDLQSEVEYYRIQEKLEREDHAIDESPGQGQVVQLRPVPSEWLAAGREGPQGHLAQGDEELGTTIEGTVLQVAEKLVLSLRDSSSAAHQIVPYAANSMVPGTASNTSLEPRLGISSEISRHTQACHTKAEYLSNALGFENLNELLHIAQKNQSITTDPRETSSCPTKPKVYGRDQERDFIISKLTSDESAGQDLSVLAIIGYGGVGKTTLANVVFNDLSVLKHFTLRVWVYVSAYFDQAKIIHKMLESLIGNGHEEIKSLKELYGKLEYALKSKRVLLVLDDMWEDSQKEKWSDLLTPLLSNDVRGNKIIITTRKPSVVKLTGAKEHINLGGLMPDDFWHLFKECAFGDENYNGHPKLQLIGEKVVVQLKGNPLAAKSVGKILKKNLDVDFWRRILDDREWKNQKDDYDIMPALMISYKYLPRDLKPCFSYCAVFPKYYRYEEECLVNMWIAQGLVCSTDMNKRLEDIGSDLFNDLVEWGFFQKEFELGNLLIMHDLHHDLAQNVSSHESFTIENNDPKEVPWLVRHLSVITEREYEIQKDGTVGHNESFLQEFSKSFSTLKEKKLSTLMLFGPHDLDFANTLRQEFSGVKPVRVLKLEMSVFALDSLIGDISAFINLRYLELACFHKGPRLELPKAICRLYHLQVLDIKKNWGADTVLPRGMNRLVNLRHFLAEEELVAKIAGIGLMVSLQEVKAFGVRKTSDFSISQLRRLNQLRGSISIYNLKDVGSREEAIEARISDKVHLTTLHLSWYSVSGNTFAARSKLSILEDLKPHAGLVNLRIEACREHLPSWLSNNVHLTSLRSLHLNNCKWLTIPQPHELPHLQELHLINMLYVSEIVIGRLEILELRNLQRLKQCTVLDNELLSASLRVLEVELCTKLEGFPLQLFISTDMQSVCQFTSLRRLQVLQDHCLCYSRIPQLLRMDSLTDIDLTLQPYGQKFQLRPYSRKLKLGPFGTSNGLRMQIKGSRQVSRIDERLFSFGKLRNLLVLEISDYQSLTYLSWEGFQQLASLKKLKMIMCCKLFSNDVGLTLPPSIEELEFHSCNISGQQLSQFLLSLPSLKILYLDNCEKVSSLPVGLFTDEHNQVSEGSWQIPPNCFNTLEILQITFTGSGGASSVMHFSSGKGLGRFVSLRNLIIGDCPALFYALISGGASDIPASSLVKLSVRDIKDSCMRFPKLSSLVELKVLQCLSLESVNLDSCTALQQLEIERCDSLSSLEGLQSCAALCNLSIHGCKVLPSLEASLGTLTTLGIKRNPNLGSLDLHSCETLLELCIEDCPTVESLEGLKSLVSLQDLKVRNCPGFTRSWRSAVAEAESERNNSTWTLQVLDIDDIGVLCVPICSLLTSLKKLIIHGGLGSAHPYNDVLTDDHEKALLLLTSLRRLEFRKFEYLRSLPADFQSLASLEMLILDNCECITTLPAGGLPASLKDMDIHCCSKELGALCIEFCHRRLHLWVDGTAYALDRPVVKPVH